MKQSELYPEYYVVSCDDCSFVITSLDFEDKVSDQAYLGMLTAAILREAKIRREKKCSENS